MKYSVFSILSIVLAIFISCKSANNDNSGELSTDVIHNPISANGNSSKNSLPEFEWTDTNHDFGTIIQGEKVSHTFTFINSGGSDLIISNSKASCGCTVPKYERRPIKPGETGKVEVLFDSKRRNGSQKKTITLFANTQPNYSELTITAEIYVPN